MQPKFHGKVYTVKEKMTTPGKQRVSVNKQIDSYDEKGYLRPMPKSTLPPAFPTGPLNLNTDGTKINYKNHTLDLGTFIGIKQTQKKLSDS